MASRSITTKDVALLHQLRKNGQLELAPEFQRNSVWPSAAKAYLIDTILNDRPIPVLFFQRGTSAQTGQQQYVVIDGQQRLRAMFDFLEDRFALTQSDPQAPYVNRKFSALPQKYRASILQYDLLIQELVGYSDDDIKDLFVRMNRFVVKLSPQEIRHARESGAFRDFVEELGALDYWSTNRVFSASQLKRFRAVEFSAELVILLVEGPQDKKKAVDLYYGKYRDKIPFKREVASTLGPFLQWIAEAVPGFPRSRYRKPVDLYSLVGALRDVAGTAARLTRLDKKAIGQALRAFEKQTTATSPKGHAAMYVAAASRQTDNIRPRATRIALLSHLIAGDLL